MPNLQELYARHAERFDEIRRGSSMERPYLDRVASLVETPCKVLDVGCGAGEPIARYFVEKACEVTGVDFVQVMLDLCKSRFSTMKVVKSDMRALDLSEAFDVVIAWDSLFHLGCDDQRAALGVLRKHTAPGGILLFTSGTIEGEGPGGDLFGDELYHGSLNTKEYRKLLVGHGYEVVQHRVEDPDCGGHTVWIARLTDTGVTLG